MGCYDTVIVPDELAEELDLKCLKCGKTFTHLQTKDLSSSFADFFLFEDTNNNMRLASTRNIVDSSDPNSSLEIHGWLSLKSECDCTAGYHFKFDLKFTDGVVEEYVYSEKYYNT